MPGLCHPRHTHGRIKPLGDDSAAITPPFLGFVLARSRRPICVAQPLSNQVFSPQNPTCWTLDNRCWHGHCGRALSRSVTLSRHWESCDRDLDTHSGKFRDRLASTVGGGSSLLFLYNFSSLEFFFACRPLFVPNPVPQRIFTSAPSSQPLVGLRWGKLRASGGVAHPKTGSEAPFF